METVTKIFAKLHEKGCFVIPNPWDQGSAVLFAQLGFPALATSSAALAFSQAKPDTATSLSRAEVLSHIYDIVTATALPVNADFQSGYGDTPEEVAESVLLCVQTGVAGLSIEDACGLPEKPLFELSEAVERIQAAREAIKGSGVLLTGRAECYLTGHPQPLEESLLRLRGYSEAGADVLFAPGVKDKRSIQLMVEAVAPKPLNLLMSSYTGLTVADLAELGVRRVSVGGALARCAWTAVSKAARAIAERGVFEDFEGILTTGEVSAWFGH